MDFFRIGSAGFACRSKEIANAACVDFVARSDCEVLYRQKVGFGVKKRQRTFALSEKKKALRICSSLVTGNPEVCVQEFAQEFMHDAATAGQASVALEMSDVPGRSSPCGDRPARGRLLAASI